nr:DUF6157 family protein [Chryseobacterium pennae]
MKQHSTNYTNTFIEVAEDCPVSHAQVPPDKKEKTLANLQYEKISKHPYQYSSDDIIFDGYAFKNDISENEKQKVREQFFPKVKPASALLPSPKDMDSGFIIIRKGK